MTEKIDIEQVASEWEIDSSIDKTALSQEIIKTSSLHSKYLKFFLQFRNESASAKARVGRMGNLKRKYYRGECTKIELDKYGWNQYQGLKPSLSELNSLLEYDKDMITLRQDLADAEASVQVMEYIMKQISQRDYTMRNLFECEKYMNGG